MKLFFVMVIFLGTCWFFNEVSAEITGVGENFGGDFIHDKEIKDDVAEKVFKDIIGATIALNKQGLLFVPGLETFNTARKVVTGIGGLGIGYEKDPDDEGDESIKRMGEISRDNKKDDESDKVSVKGDWDEDNYIFFKLREFKDFIQGFVGR